MSNAIVNDKYKILISNKTCKKKKKLFTISINTIISILIVVVPLLRCHPINITIIIFVNLLSKLLLLSNMKNLIFE